MGRWPSLVVSSPQGGRPWHVLIRRTAEEEHPPLLAGTRQAGPVAAGLLQLEGGGISAISLRHFPNLWLDRTGGGESLSGDGLGR